VAVPFVIGSFSEVPVSAHSLVKTLKRGESSHPQE
jgi:hypothetical protein